MRRKRLFLKLGMASSLWLCATTLCVAGDFDKQPLEVRLWTAMSRSVTSTDAIGRQASVAFLSASSDNPAGMDVRDAEGEETVRFLCAGTHHVVFGNGAWIAAVDANGLIRRQKAGSMLMGYSHIALADGQTRQGFNDDLRNSEFVFKYGHQIQPDAYIGIGFRVRDMRLDYGDLFLGMPRITRNESIAGSFTLGGLWRAGPLMTFGVLSETGWIRSDVKGAIQLPGPMSVPFNMELTTQTLNIKAGMRWKMLPALTVYSDGQFYHLGNRITGVQVGRFYFGADLRVVPRILVIGGASVDTLSQVSESVGISIALSRPRLIKLTYQHNPLPEIRHEFGRGNLLSASMVFGF